VAGVVDAPGALARTAEPPATTLGSTIVELVSASEDVLVALGKPAEDAASPAPVDPAAIPRPTGGSLDPTVLPADSGAGRRAVYSINRQRVWLVESDGTVSRTYLVSGRLDRPGPGEYEVYSRSRNAVSFNGTERMEYMIRFAHGERAAIGFHDIPVDGTGAEVQTVQQLGQPLSAGCVRQAEADAIALWDWAPVGTKVVVVA
jgi:lipoprotein-anchoring transpeptidase ErfK/SrfK